MEARKIYLMSKVKEGRMPFITPKELIERKSERPGTKSITVVFGRFQPPTLGHKVLFDMAVKNSIENGGDVVIVATSSCPPPPKTVKPSKGVYEKAFEVCDRVKYPLTYAVKKDILERLYPGEFFPNHMFLDIADDKAMNSFIGLLTFLNKEVGYTELYIISGDDRVETFQKMAVEKNGPNKFYHFEKIHPVVDVGGGQDRATTEILGLNVKISGTMVRIASLLNQFNIFYPLINTGHLSEESARYIMEKLRSGMGMGAGVGVGRASGSVELVDKTEVEILSELMDFLLAQKKIIAMRESNKRKRGMGGGFYMDYMYDLFSY